MTRRRLIALTAAVVFLVCAVVVTFAPVGRYDGACGAWVSSDPSDAVAANQRMHQAFADVAAV